MRTQIAANDFRRSKESLAGSIANPSHQGLHPRVECGGVQKFKSDFVVG
jgi:hypothetical protein